MTAPIRSPAYFFVNYYLNLLNHGKKIKTTWAEHGPETPGLKTGPTPALHSYQRLWQMESKIEVISIHRRVHSCFVHTSSYKILAGATLVFAKNSKERCKRLPSWWPLCLTTWCQSPHSLCVKRVKGEHSNHSATNVQAFQPCLKRWLWQHSDN